MLKLHAGARISRVLDPVGAALLRTGLTPDVVTIIGTVGVVAGSIVFVARGQLLWGVLVIGLLLLTDMLDGAMARARGTASTWGAFLDSTMDRIADGAIFGALAFWLASTDRPWAAAAALTCLVAGVVVSYAKARAESLGLRCDVGIAERGERLILAGVGALLEGLGVPYALDIALWLLTVVAIITVGQRMAVVWQQTKKAGGA